MKRSRFSRGRMLLAILCFGLAASTGRGQQPTPGITTLPVSIDPFVNSIRNSTSVCFGQFELVGFPRGSMTVGSVELGERTTYRFSLQFSNSATARLYVYPKSAVLTKLVGDRCNSSPEAWRSAVLSAEVRDAVILGKLETQGNSITAMRVPRLTWRNRRMTSGLSLVVSGATPESRSVLSGTIELGSDILTVENRDEDVTVTLSELEGSVRINSKKARLSARVGLIGEAPGAEPLVFTVPPSKRAEIKVDLVSGQTTLTNGDFLAGAFSSNATPAVPSTIAIGRLRLAFTGLKAMEAALWARDSALGGRFKQVTLDIGSGSYSSHPRVVVTGVSKATALSVDADVKPTVDALEFSPSGIGALELTADQIRLGTSPIELSGAGRIGVSRLDREGVQGSISLETAALQRLGGMSGAARLEPFKISGASTVSSCQGSISGGVRLIRLGHVAILPEAGSLNGTFTPAGDLNIQAQANAPGRVAILAGAELLSDYEADLSGASFRASVSPSLGRVTFAPQSISLRINALRAAYGRLFGGVPTFGPQAMKLENSNAVVLEADAASGALDSLSPSFGVLTPQIWSAARDLALPLGGDLVGSGSTALKTILGTGAVVPVSGLLVVDNINVTPPVSVPSVTLRISGIDLDVKSLRIARLELRAGFDAANHIARANATGTAVEIEAGRIVHKDNPTFQATATAPVTATSVSAEVAFGREPLQLTDFSVQGASMKLADLDYSTPDKVGLKAASAALDLKSLSNVQAEGSLAVEGAEVRVEGASASRASVKSLTLAFSGPKENPLADGHIRFDTIAFVSQSKMQVENCGGNQLPLRISVQAGGLEGRISIVEKRTDFAFASNDAQFQLFRPLEPVWECEWDQKVGELSVSYWCCDNWCGGFLKYPCDCHLCTHKISDINARWIVTVGGFQSSGLITQIKLRPDPDNGGIKPCEGHLTQLNPPLVGTFALHPTIPGGNLVSDAVRARIFAAVAPMQTSFVNAAGLYGSIASLTHVGDRFYLWEPCH